MFVNYGLILTRILMRNVKKEMLKASEDLENSIFGVDHLFREISHIYDAIFEHSLLILPSDLLSKNDVAAIFADFIIEGESFEVIDGDSMFMAKSWMKAVTRVADKKMGKARLVSLSVLGLQSSGKSTMLNTMLGVHFSVSTGKCTKGINAKLLPVRSNDTDKDPFEYVMVVDSEGLRDPEHGDIGTHSDRDNTLATFVTGLGDLTLMNIMGENFSEMKDILQIVIHALLRLKSASTTIRSGQSCVFVHHNVSEKTAGVNTKDGFVKLVELLDSVTQEAAKVEGISNITRFNEIIKFHEEENVFHIPNLWQGKVPMNRVNTGYSDGVLFIKSRLIEILSGVSGKSLSDFIVNAKDLWKGILAENFVFSFINSLEITAYCLLEEKVQKEIWDIEMKLKKNIRNKMQNQFASCTNTKALEEQKHNLIIDLRTLRFTMEQQVTDNVEKLFKTSEYPDIVIKWQGVTEFNIKHRCEQLEITERNVIETDFQKYKIGIVTASISSKEREELCKISMKIAKRLHGQAMDDNMIQEHFNLLWVSFMTEVNKKKQPCIQGIDDVLQHLHEIHKNNATLLMKELKRVNSLPSRQLDFHLCNIDEDDVSIWTSVDGNPKPSQMVIMQTVKKEIERLFLETDCKIKELTQKLQEISDIEIKKFVYSIWDCLTTLSTKNKAEQFTLKKTALIKAHVHICLYAWPLFQRKNETYDKKHGTIAQLNKYRKEMFISFKDCINNRRAEETLAKLFCKGVRRSFKKIIQRNVCVKVEQELLSFLPSIKDILIKEICIYLANKNNFEEFINYLKNPEEFASSWYKKKGDELLFLNKRYTSIVEGIITCMTGELKSAIKSLRASLKAPVNGSAVFDAVSEQLENKPEALDFVSFRTDERKIEDIGYFTEILLGETEELKHEIDSVSRDFKSVTAQNVIWEVNPYDNLINLIWGCKETCPFCNEPCAKSNTNHASSNHYCSQHRIQCCVGVLFEDTQNAAIEVCNYDIQSDCRFRCSFTNGKCPLGTGECRQHLLPFREYKTYFPDWNIPPSTNAQDCSKFWLWFVNEHKQKLSAHYGYAIRNIPSDWSDITKEMAIASLDYIK